VDALYQLNPRDSGWGGADLAGEGVITRAYPSTMLRMVPLAPARPLRVPRAGEDQGDRQNPSNFTWRSGSLWL